MISRIKSILGRGPYITREHSHGEMIEKIIRERQDFFKDSPVFVETGCGMSTVSLSKCANEFNAVAYSFDYNSDKSDELKERVGDQVANIEFVIGDSLENLPEIVAKHTIDFLFLDSAASAMHTFREFLICEPALKPGASLLVDNAALPGEKLLLTPCRKGKVLVPYLLASPYWDVSAHPTAGDSMISATLQSEADFADFDYEHPEYIDNWKIAFDKKL